MLKKRFFFLFPLLFTSACYVNLTGVDSIWHGFPSVGSDSAPSDSESFYVDLDPEAYKKDGEHMPSYDINTTTEYGDSAFRESPSNCEIKHTPIGEGGGRHSTDTMVCILGIPEWGFILKDLHLVYNFPAGMCEYTSVALPWHFNYPLSPGPVVEACQDDPGTENVVESGYRCNNSEISTCDGTCYEKEEDLCPGGDGGPICCHGGERKTTGERWMPERECFGGPGLIASKFSEGNGFLFRHVQPSSQGIKQTLSFKSLSSFTNLTPTSAPYANYLKVLDQPLDNLKDFNRNSLPVFLQQSAYFPYAPRLFFEFVCYDEAVEPLHKTLLQIEEWNTPVEIASFVLTSGNPDDANPDVEGIEKKECENETGIAGIFFLSEEHVCNDLLDLDDLSSCDSRIPPVLCKYFAQDGYPRFPYKEDVQN